MLPHCFRLPNYSLNVVTKKPEEVQAEEWMKNVRLNMSKVTRAQMNKLIMNYLVTEGFKEAAEKFQMEANLRPEIDLDTLGDRVKIREEIQAGRILDAIKLINELFPELLDDNKYLFFHLQQQHLIELIREKKIPEALYFAQNELSEKGENFPDLLKELERTMALMAFDEPEKSHFGDLLHVAHRQKVASEVNAAILLKDDTQSTPVLSNLIKMVIWSQNQLDDKLVPYPHLTDILKVQFSENTLHPTSN